MSLTISRKFICDDDGRPVEVVLSIEQYMEILEQLEDQADLQLLKDRIATATEFRSWDEIEEELRAAGKL